MADKTDTKLYSVISSLYVGEQKLNTKIGTTKDDILTGWLGYSTEKPVSGQTVDARLDLLEAGTSAASGTLTIAGKAYTPSTGDKEITIDDIQATYVTAPAENATGLAAASAVYAADQDLQEQIDDIASSFITGAIDPNDNVLSLGVDGQNITGAIAVDGTTVIKGASGLKTGLKLVKKQTVGDSNNAAEYFLADSTGTAIEGSAEINIIKDQFLQTASYDATTEELVLTFNVPSGTLVSRIDVKDMVHEYTGSDAITVANTVDGDSAISLKLDDSGEDFLSITSDGLLLSGVQAAIDAASADATNGLTTLSAALTNYLGENAVSGKFAEIDTKLGEASNAAENHIFIADASGNLKDSGKVIGEDVLDETPADSVVATEAAVAAADAALYDRIVNTEIADLEASIAAYVATI